jgi:hypothetical protein
MLPDRAERLCNDILSTASPDVNERCVAWDLLHDHRISARRATHWEGHADAALGYSLEAAIRVYFDLVLNRPQETYRSTLNTTNIPSISDSELPAPGKMLVQVLDLTNRRSMAIWQFGKDLGFTPLGGLDLSRPDTLAADLDDLLSKMPLADQVPLMDAFFAAQRLHLEGGNAQGPVWVALWDDWRDRIDPNEPESWAGTVGLSKEAVGRCFAVLKYPARRAGVLVRPTQLEASWYGRHFPSPPACALGTGGRIMRGDPARTVPPLREYIHAPILWSVQDWLLSDIPVRSTRAKVGSVSSLRADRAAHWQALGVEVGTAELTSWMVDPNG